jgi:hypothetical protein
VLNVAASDVSVFSSVPTARIQGAGRKVHFRGATTISCGISFNTAFEGQHAIRIRGDNSSPPANNVEIDLTNISCEFVNGDGIGFGMNVSGITIVGQNLGEAFMGGTVAQADNGFLMGYTGQGGTIVGSAPNATWSPGPTGFPGIHHTGRQGIGIGFTLSDVLIDGIGLWRIGRTAFDLEVANVGGTITNFEVRNTECGIHTLNWISAAARRCVNVTFEDNICYENINIDTRTGSGTRHEDWVLSNNRNFYGPNGTRKKGPVPCFAVDRIDALQVLDNYNLRSNSTPAIYLGSSTNVTIDPAATVQFPAAP